MEPEVLDAEVSAELGYFFKHLGVLCFSPASTQAFPGPASDLAVAARCGAIFFSDAQGLYACKTSELLPRLQKWSNSDEEMPPISPTEAAAVVLPLAGAALLSLSPDDALLAACRGTTVRVYSTQQLLAGSTAVLAEVHLPLEVLQLAWRPAAAAEFAVLLADGGIQLGILASGTAPVPLAAAAGMPATCLAWSPDGGRLALGAGDEVALYTSGPGGVVGGWELTASMRVLSSELQEDDQEVQVDTLSWMTESAVLVSSKLLTGGVEQPYAPLCVLSWRGAIPAEGSLALWEFFANNISEDTAVRGPWLQTTAVPQWGVTVFAHRKASDDHVKLAAMVDGRPVVVDVTDDRMSIRIPNALVDADNFVVGLGVDCTCTGVQVLHPTDPTAPDLPPQPVLLVGTSDGVLRFYTFGRTDSSTCSAAACLVTPPQPLPPPPRLVAAVPAADAMPMPAVLHVPVRSEDKAAATMLPDEDSDFWEEEEEEEEEESLSVKAKAAASTLPKDKLEAREEEDQASTPKALALAAAAAAPKKLQGLAAPVPAEGGSDKGAAAAKPLFGSATPSFGFGATTEPPAPAFGFGPPAAASAPTFGFGAPASTAASTAPPIAPVAFGFGGPFSFGSAASTSSGVFGAAAAAAAAPVSFPQHASSAPAGALAPSPPKLKAAAVQPPMPSPAQVAESQNLLAKVQPQATPHAPAAGESKPKPATAAAAAAVPPKSTAVAAPRPRLADEAKEVAAMEADFLRSLLQTRQLEASTHDALAAALKGTEGPHTAAAFAKLQQRTWQLQQAATTASGRLAQQRQQVAEMVAATKDALRKSNAMPAFKPGGAATGGGGTLQLLQKQPLEPALDALRDDICQQMQQLRLTVDDLQECLMAIEERQRQLRSGDAPPPRLTTQHIYNTVNAQMAIIQGQAARLQELTARLEARGLLDNVDLDLDLDELTDEEGGLPLDHKLTRLVLTPGRGTPGARGSAHRSPAPHDSASQQRSPWRLVAESPASQQHGGGSRNQTPLSRQRLSPLGLASSPATAGSGAAAGAGRWALLQQQLLQRCQAEGGGVRITTAKKLATMRARSTPAAPAVQPQLPAPSLPPELPPYSLVSTAKPAAQPASGALPPAASGATGSGGLGAALSSTSGNLFSAPASDLPTSVSFSSSPASSASSAAAGGAHYAPGTAAAGAFFLPAASLEGAKPGYVFKLDGSGLGYYKDAQLPTAGSLFGKRTAKPKALASQPPMPSLAQAAESQKLLAKVQPTAVGAKPMTAALQPLMPTLAQAAESQKLLAKVQPAVTDTKPKAAASQPPMPTFVQAAESPKLLAQAGLAAPKPAAAVSKPEAAAMQPPMPSLAQAVESQKLLQKVQPAGSSRQPPMPWAAAAQAAQDRFTAFLGNSSSAAAADISIAATSPATTAAAAPPGPAPVSGFGVSSGAGALFGAAAPAASSTAAAEPAAAAPAAASSDATTSLSFGTFGVGGASSAAAASPFGKGVAFGASNTAAATPSFGFGAAPGVHSSPASIFGAASSAAAPTSLLGASISATVPTSVFGAVASSAAEPTSVFGAAPASTSPFGGNFGTVPPAASSAATGSPFGGGAFGAAPQSGAAGSPFGAFGSSASSPATGSPLGQMAAATAAPFGMPAKPASVFGVPPTLGFSQQVGGFGVVASQPPFGAPATPGFGHPAAGFGAAASQPAFGQPSAFGAPPTQPASVFGTPAQPGGGFGAASSLPAFGQTSGFGQSAGFAAAAQQGGGFSAFGQQQQPAVGISPFGGGGFGQQMGGGFIAFGSSPAAMPPKPSGGAMWQPRK